MRLAFPWGKAGTPLEHFQGPRKWQLEVLHKAAREGDTKAALDILKHVHRWTAPQSVQVQIEQKISILAALEEAQARVVEGYVLDNAKAADADTSGDLLTNRNEDGGYGDSYARSTEKSTAL